MNPWKAQFQSVSNGSNQSLLYKFFFSSEPFHNRAYHCRVVLFEVPLVVDELIIYKITLKIGNFKCSRVLALIYYKKNFLNINEPSLKLTSPSAYR